MMHFPAFVSDSVCVCVCTNMIPTNFSIIWRGEKTNLSGSVITSSTTVPGRGLSFQPALSTTRRVLIFLDTTMKANLGVFSQISSKHRCTLIKAKEVNTSLCNILKNTVNSLITILLTSAVYNSKLILYLLQYIMPLLQLKQAWKSMLRILYT